LGFFSDLEIGIDHFTVRQQDVVPWILGLLQATNHVDRIILHKLARCEIGGMNLRRSLILEALSGKLLLLMIEQIDVWGVRLQKVHC